jgi:hypothetical protein
MKLPPLSPKAGGGSCLASSALAPADIIVSTTNEPISRIIKFGSGFSEVSHAILYVGNDQVIEAIEPKVTERMLGISLGEATLAVVYRHKLMTPASAIIVVGHAKSLIGTSYDYSGAVGAGLSHLPAQSILGRILTLSAEKGAFNRPSRFYCSELVFASYDKAHLPLAAISPHTSRPQEIVSAFEHGVLRYVGHLK